MSDSDPNISNGTCYNAANVVAPSRFIPCGNSALGHIPCCESLDVCLASNACYNGQFGVTYLAGCTDSSYENQACPNKNPYQGYTWVGLSYCNGTSNEWIACPNTEKTVTSPQPCWCPETRIVAFSEPSVIPNQVSLPASKGQSVSWFPYFTPTYIAATSNAAASSTVSAVASSATSSPQNTQGSNVGTSHPTLSTPTTQSPSSSPTSSPSTLSTGDKAGIGVGAGIAGIAMLAAIVALLWHYSRKRQQAKEEEEYQKQLSAPYSDHTTGAGGEMRSPAWSGNKSELAANDSAITQSPLYNDHGSPKSEVEGSPGMGGDSRPISDGGYEVAGRSGTVYEMP